MTAMPVLISPRQKLFSPLESTRSVSPLFGEQASKSVHGKPWQWQRLSGELEAVCAPFVEEGPAGEPLLCAGASLGAHQRCAPLESDPELLAVDESIFNIVNTMVGSGVLSVPYAFKLSGYATGALLLTVVAVMSYTAELIGKALDLVAPREEARSVPRHCRDYSFLAQVVFGPLGRRFVGLLTGLELWMALVTFLAMTGINAQLLFGTELRLAIGCSTALSAVMVHIPMRVYAYISLSSLVMLMVGASSFVVYALARPSWACHSPSEAQWSLASVPRSVGLLTFCFAGHPCFPSVHENMQEPERWRTTVGCSFFMTLLYYGGFGVIGYLVFGQELAPVVTANVARKSAFHGVLIFSFLLKTQLQAPLILRAILVGSGITADKGRAALAGEVLLAALTAASACLLSGDIAALASLCGSLLVMFTSVFVPVALYWRLEGRALGGRAALACLFAALFGVVFGTSGTCLAALDLSRASG